MATVQEQPPFPILKDFNALVTNLHSAVDTIASQVVNKVVNNIEARDPSLVSDKSSPLASSELVSAVQRVTSLTSFHLTPRPRQSI